MKHTIRKLSSKGDDTFTYNPEVETEFVEAQKRFKELKSTGYKMFSVDPETKDTELVEDLFKRCPNVIAVPQIQGG